MKCTVSALYETRAQAEQASSALKAAGLGGEVDISDRDASSTHGAHKEGGHLGWLTRWFGGHRDAHVYGEGLRRGHVLLSAKVDDLAEMRVAQILEAGQPMDLGHQERAWSAEGWQAPEAATPSDAPTGRARSYPVTDPVTRSQT